MRHNKLHTVIVYNINNCIQQSHTDSDTINRAVKPLAPYMTSSELHKYNMVSLLA